MSNLKAKGKNLVESFWAKLWVKRIAELDPEHFVLRRARSLIRREAVRSIELNPLCLRAEIEEKEKINVELIFESISEESKQFSSELGKDINFLLNFKEGFITDEQAHSLCSSKYPFFPKSQDFKVSCNCLEDIRFCSHAAVSLYAFAIKFEKKPLAILELRDVDLEDLLRQKSLLSEDRSDLDALFDIDLIDPR